ncbi:aminopeptidase P family protein [Ignatzschineria cameli]|uniref:Xaa-Pro aminopeptidase n=2 Tax=Bacteria TaxID=2 RepID=A0A2U2ASD2_9GAMM|nr:aminopeptidase P family protein [Ignatzschineria cameli]PWD87099.1 Xaa-Pro aminopeptidase [Ignatzschineria cameli]PWD92072.1 Xaa-Pro aminopeptidase [Ignatzschineria cameli]PWD93343.1 Xaa-Pro aminopeptidase [Ignatzschineria cameli]PWD94085.1 Xaa-Pro aminopeptidase [Ignatzschineria cameli]
MSKSSEINARIAALQKQMIKDKIDAWIILSADPHLSEYLPDHWKLREWFSGFTGSAGTLVVLQKSAYIWADSRYWVQAAKELQGTTVELMKLGAPNTPSYIHYLQSQLKPGAQVALLPDTMSVENFVESYEALDDFDITLTTQFNPFDRLISNRAPLPSEKLYLHEDQFLSESLSDKVRRIRKVMSDEAADVHIISTLDDIAWLTNLRGRDVTYNPVFLAFVMITPSSVTLFIDEEKLTPEVKKYLTEHKVTVFPYDTFYDELGNIPADKTVMLDEKRTTYAALEAIDEACEILYLPNPSTLFKAQKSDEDLAHIQEAMIEDGVAMAHFYTQFEARMANGEKLTELDVAEGLASERAKRPHFIDLSFDTIAGFNPNGALPHYRATEKDHAIIEGDGLLLIDSGAQYKNGTTDITRVIPIGQPSTAQKQDFTFVLKSLIAMSSTIYPENIAMPLLDAIARKPLWQHQLDYGHGTGHGVGYFLNVHEGPQVLSYHATPNPQMRVKKGMVTSIEPGIYREGKWGVRIENLVTSQPISNPKEQDFGNFMFFETLTLFPIDTRLMERSLLTAEEIEWVNQYHQSVYEKLAPRIEDEAVLAWLKERTAAI